MQLWPTADFQRVLTSARHARMKYPLHSGRYKLEEALTLVRDWQYTLNEVGAYLRGELLLPAGAVLGNHCTTDDLEEWLTSIMEAVTWQLGYYVLPAVSALEGDGLPDYEVVRLAAFTQTGVKVIADQYAQVREVYGVGVDLAPPALLRGIPILAVTMGAAVDLIECLFDQIDHYQSPSPAVH